MLYWEEEHINVFDSVVEVWIWWVV